MKMKVIIAAFILIGLIFISGCNTPANNSNTGGQTANEKVICKDLSCIGSNFPSCKPSELIMNSGGQSVTISILGFENEKCHYTMAFGNVTSANCYFNKEDLTEKVLNQMFGNKEGQDAIIAQACK